MPAADTARLIASLELDNRKFLASAAQSTRTLDKINGRLGAFSGAVNRNLGRLVDSTIQRGTQALVDGIQGGIDSLAQLEDATTSVNGAIRTVGLTGQVTGQQIADWANQIEASTQAAFDDKEITAATATLIRYGKVSSSNLRPAMQVMTDLAARTGSVESASTALAKALADPAKSAGVLKRAGVVLTKQQQDQIKALVKAGKTGKAQALVLQLLAKSTKNAARDMHGPFRDMQNTLRDTVEDAQRLLGAAAMPVLQKIGTRIQQALADPKTMKAIQDFGVGVGNALDKVIAFVDTVPWDKVASGLSTAAGFAGDLIGAFTSMPPEVQGTIIALAGLNKLSGGAISGIVSDLGKGLIKGVLGMTAAVVNLNAGVVKGVPGAPGGGGGTGGSGGTSEGGGGTGEGGAKGGTAGVGVFVPDMHQFNKDVADRLEASGTKFGSNAAQAFNRQAAQDTLWDQILRGLGFATSPLIGQDSGGKGQANIGKLVAQKLSDNSPANIGQAVAQKLQPSQSDIAAKQAETYRAMLDNKAVAGAGLSRIDSTTRSGTSGTTAAVNTSGSRIAGAIAANRPIVDTRVYVNVTAASVQKATTTSTRYGNSNGSYGGGTGGGGQSKYD